MVLGGFGGTTAFMEAVDIGDKEMIELLLRYDADPYIQDDKGQNAFNYAEREKIKKLLENAELPGPKRAEK